jgi:hypothetical protein
MLTDLSQKLNVSLTPKDNHIAVLNLVRSLRERDCLVNIGIDERKTSKCEFPSYHGGNYQYYSFLGCCAVNRPIALMMEAVSASEISVSSYQTTSKPR